jgi:hypothetical protein
VADLEQNHVMPLNQAKKEQEDKEREEARAKAAAEAKVGACHSATPSFNYWQQQRRMLGVTRAAPCQILLWLFARAAQDLSRVEGAAPRDLDGPCGTAPSSRLTGLQAKKEQEAKEQEEARAKQAAEAKVASCPPVAYQQHATCGQHSSQQQSRVKTNDVPELQ